MKTKIIYFLFSLLGIMASTNLFAQQSPEVLWATGFGNGQTDSGTAYPSAVTTDQEGNVYVVGDFFGIAHFGSTVLTAPDDNEFYVVKLNSSGQVIWVEQFGGVNDDDTWGYTVSSDITIDSSGNLYITGKFTGTADFGGTILTSNGSSDIFVMKMNSSGNVVWTESFGGNGSDSGYAVTTDATNNVYVTGVFGGTFTFGTTTVTAFGMNDAFTTKFDSDGEVLWIKTAGGIGANTGGGGTADVAVDSSGNVIITGSFTGTINFDTEELIALGNNDVFVVKYSSVGTIVWAKQFGGTVLDIGHALATDSLGNIYTTGQFAGTASFGSNTLTSAGGNDIYVLKLDSVGDVVWVQQFGDAVGDIGRGIDTDEAGNVYVTGQVRNFPVFGTSFGGNDIFVLKLDTTGNTVWAEQYGSIAGVGDQGRDIVVDNTGNVYVIGLTEGTVDFGDFTVTNYSIPTIDTFLIKIEGEAPAEYCEPTSTALSEVITSFTTTGAVANITNSTGTTISPNGYGDFTAMEVVQEAGETIDFTIGINSMFSINIWVDWNNDMEFDESEKVYTEPVPLWQSTFSGSILVPEGTPAGSYRMRVRGSTAANPLPCGNISAGEAEDYTLTVIEAPAEYCEPTSTTLSEVITSFTTTGGIINIVNNTGTVISPNGYGDFTTMEVVQEAGESIDFTLVINSLFSVNIWVDWNNNGVFDESEKVYFEPGMLWGPFSGSISIPSGTPVGSYRMRVRGGGVSNPPACGNVSYGEAEDYTITVIEAPTCMPPTGLGAEILTLTSAELFWTSGEDLFEIQYGESGFTFGDGTVITGITTTSYELQGLTDDTYYEYYIRTICSGGESLWQGPYLFLVGYCESIYSYTESSTAITSFITTGAITNINNVSGNTIYPNGYANHTDLSVSHFETGVIEFDLTVSSWSSFGFGIKIWVDWNNNLEFEESEVVYSANSGNTFLGSITIPEGTPVGNYRMRIKGVYNTSPFNILPCGTVNWGETEDYTLTVIPTPTCIPPLFLTATNISVSSTLLSWQSNGELFDIEYGPTGFTPGTGTIISGVSNPYVLTGLIAGTLYQYYVRMYCEDEDDYSTWSEPFEFKPGIFEGDIPTMLNPNPQVEDIACATSFAIDVPEGQYLASLTVEYVMTSASPALDSHQRSVLYSSTLGMGETQIATHPNPQDFPGLGYYSRSIDFANGATGTVEFELKAWRTTGGSGCSTDLVFVEDGTWVLNATFEDIPTCPNPPVDLGYTNITEDSVDLIWASDETGTFQIKWGDVGFNVETAGTSVVDINGYSHTLSGLDSSIQYEFYVRRDCSTDDEEDFGIWVGPVRFNSGHCIPYATQGAYFTLFNTTNAAENVTYSFPSGSPFGTGYVNTDLMITQNAGESFDFTSNYIGNASGLRIWVDWNNNFVFEDDEQVYFLANTSGNKSGTITIPVGTEPGDYRMRVRAQQGATSTPPACGLIVQGEALDFTLRVSCEEIATPTGAETQLFDTGETLADLDVTGDNLVWYADEDLTIVLDPSTELVHDTTYYVVSTNGGCQSEYLAVTVEQTSSVSDFNSFGFRYYPNPVSELLYLNANAPISNVTVINMLGQQVNVSANSSNTNVDMSELPTGNYLIKVTIEGVSKTFKVVKQ